MTDKLAQLLQTVISSSENPYFKEIGELIYRICRGETRVFSGEEMWRFVIQPHERHLQQQDLEKNIEFLDRRIIDLGVRNFRTFSQTADNKMCGVRLHKGGRPLSVFMVGSNGSGKSSLFSALETIYSGNITIKRLMNISDEDNYELHDFGKEGQVGKSEVEIAARFADNTIIKRNFSAERPIPICPPSAFCSDYDVEQVSRHKSDLTPFILSQNGYGAIYDFHSKILSEWINDLDELQISKQAEQQRIAEIGLSKDELVTVFSTLLLLMQDSNSNFDLGYYIDVCDDIIENINTSIEELLSIDKSDKNRALPEIMSSLNGLIKSLQKIRIGQQNKQAYPTISVQWRNLMKSLEKEEHRLTDDILSIANDILSDTRPDFSIKSKALDLKKQLRLCSDDYKKIKADLSIWPQIQDEYIKNMALLQADEVAEISVENYLSQVTTLRNSVLLFKEKLGSEIDAIIEAFIKTQGNNIDKALTWFALKGEKFHFHKDVATGHPVVTISYKSDNVEIDTYPSLYLNTFRFRIFAITLKIALAFSFMQQERILVPIVIDEVFNSSDFENRLRLEKYVQIVYSLYDNMKISSSRLQLILFTHDEVVLRSFVRGASMRHQYEFTKSFVKDYQQVRLFCQSDAEKVNKLLDKVGNFEYLNLHMSIL